MRVHTDFGGQWERQIDRALAEACSDLGFVRWFVGAALPHVTLPSEPVPCVVALNQWEICPGGGDGENDVTLTISAGGRDVVVRVENKVGARFMPRQAERYQQRAKHWGGHTVLVAPRNRLSVRCPSEVFEGTVAIEDLIEALERFGIAERAADLRDVMANARRERDPHLPTLAFNAWLEEQLEARGVDWLKVTGNKTEKQGWPYLQLPKGFFQNSPAAPDGNLLIYKASFARSPLACVDITERYLQPWVADARRKVALPHGFSLDRDSKGVVYRRAVKALSTADGPPLLETARHDAAVDAVEAITAAAVWLLAVAEQQRQPAER